MVERVPEGAIAWTKQTKTIMLHILLDFLYMKSEVAMQEVGPILQKHLGLDDADMEEVLGRFRGEMRDQFASHPDFPGSGLARVLAEEEKE